MYIHCMHVFDKAQRCIISSFKTISNFEDFPNIDYNTRRSDMQNKMHYFSLNIYQQNPTMPTLRINLWSGPRNVSTALMYAFAQRSDTRVLDEPLYAHYLRVSDADHPGKQEVLDAMINDGERVVHEIMLGPCDRSVLFMKQMAHHLVELDRGFLAQTTNVLLIRDPQAMLPSLAQNLTKPILRDTGLAMQSALYQELRALGQNPAVLEAKQLLLDPPGVLAQLCAHLGIGFEEAMLHWQPGPRPEDGVWAPYWYHNVHTSTGFAPYIEKNEPFPPQLLPLLEECRPHYDILAQVAIQAELDEGMTG